MRPSPVCAKTNEGPLTDELRRTMSDIRAGVPRDQALRALADRAQVPEIRQLVTALLQAQKHGVPDRRDPSGPGLPRCA